MCISFPQRHTGNSVQPGTNKRSNADMASPTLPEKVCPKVPIERARIRERPSKPRLQRRQALGLPLAKGHESVKRGRLRMSWRNQARLPKQ